MQAVGQEAAGPDVGGRAGRTQRNDLPQLAIGPFDQPTLDQAIDHGGVFLRVVAAELEGLFGGLLGQLAIALGQPRLAQRVHQHRVELEAGGKASGHFVDRASRPCA